MDWMGGLDLTPFSYVKDRHSPKKIDRFVRVTIEGALISGEYICWCS